MATLTANAAASLTATGTSAATGSITWAAPVLPADAVVSSVAVSGTYTWNGRGSVTVTINGTNCSSGVPFHVALGADASPPYSITCQGGNKNATGSDFAWSNLIVTYTYYDPNGQAFHVKENGVWVECSEVYKKTNDTWVLQEDLESVIDPNQKYVRG